MKTTAMDLSELRIELDKGMTLMTDQEMTHLFAGGGPNNLRRMRSQLIGESLIIICCTLAAALMTTFVAGELPMAILFTSFALLFVATEVLGFHYFWHLPMAINLKDSLEQDLRRIQRITTGMKTLNLSLGFILAAIVLIDSNLTNQVPLGALLTMFAVKIMAWLFSIKWIKRERKLRLALKEFEDE